MNGVLKDIDLIIIKIEPSINVSQLKVTHPADDEGLWFIKYKNREVQIESSTGMSPFLIEGELEGQTKNDVYSEEAIKIILEWLGLN